MRKTIKKKSKFQFDEVQKMEKNKLSSILFYVSAILFYLSAIINFAGGNHSSTAVVWLCLGSTFLCLGAVYSNKSNDNKDSKNEE